jgi:glutaredoxin 2
MIRNQPSDVNLSDTGVMNMTVNKPSPNTTSSAMIHGNEMNDRYSLVNVSDYQSAQALSIKASKVFNDKLKFTEISNKNTTGYITNLENGLTQLNNLVAKKDSPLNVMMIVHTQIHPNLLEAFSLQLRN